MTSNIPVDLWRYIFEMKLKDDRLFIFDFTKEMILLGDYKIEEIEKMVKNAIIQNFEITEVPFFEYLMFTSDKIYISKSKIFLDYINVLNSIEDYYYIYPTWNYYFDNFDDRIHSHRDYLIWSKEEISILEYIFQTNNKIFLNFLIDKYNSEIDFDTYYNFVLKHENLEILKILKEKNKDYRPKEYHYSECCYINNLEILKNLANEKDGCIWYLNIKSIYWMVSNNNLEMLRFIREGNNRYQWDEKDCWWACWYSNLEILKFIRNENDPCPWDKEACIKLCHNKNRSNILEWINAQKG